MKRLLLIPLLSLGFIVGCNLLQNKTAPPVITITFTPGGAPALDQGQKLNLTVTVANDATNKGVTFSLSGAACTGTACGTLTNVTITSVTYNAPAGVTSNLTVTLTATSVADPTKTATMTITVTPSPSVTTTTLPNGTVGAAYSATLQESGGVSPFTWSIVAGTLPNGLTLAASTGAISGTPTTPGTSNFTVQAADSSVPQQTATKALSITITPPPLAIATASLPDGVVGTPYSQVIQATGGVSPFTWVVGAGTLLPHNLNLDNSATSKLTISGTPDMQQAAVQFTIQVTDSANQSATMSYTVNINGPPALTIGTSSVPPGTINVPYLSFSFSAAGGTSTLTWSETGALPAGLIFASNGTLSGTPTVTGSFPILVTVRDSGGQTNTKAFTIVIYPAPAVLSGRYVFQFQGFNPGGAFVAVGSFNADGFGNVSDAVLDTNSVVGPPVTNLALGTYSFDANNLGTMTLTGPQGNATFRFTLYPPAFNGISAGGKIIEFDNIKSGTGFIAAQDTTAFSKSTITGDYLFNFAGSTASLGRVAAVGKLTADGLGSFSSGVMDMNESGMVFANAMFTGNYDVPAASTNGRGTATLNTTLGGTPVTRNFTFYIQNIDRIQNAAVLIFLGNDPVRATLPLLSGSMEPRAAGPYTNNSLTGSLILGTTGLTSAGLPDITLGVVTIASGANYTLRADQNNGGTITSNNVAGTYSVEPNGRVTLTGGNHPPVLYLSGPNSGYIVGTDGNVSTGTVFARTVPLSLEGSLSVSTGAPVAANQENDFGTLTFNSGNVIGSLNIGSSTTFHPNTAVAGTYSLGSGGRGTLSITSGLHTGTSVFYLTGHSRLVLLNSNNAGDIAPVLFSGGCIHFVSSPRGGVVCR